VDGYDKTYWANKDPYVMARAVCPFEDSSVLLDCTVEELTQTVRKSVIWRRRQAMRPVWQARADELERDFIEKHMRHAGQGVDMFMGLRIAL